MKSLKSIYSYTDYRGYLRDFIAEKQQSHQGYSLRCAALNCGIPSGTLARILNGTRNIGPSLLPKFIEYLKVKKKESEYFSALVHFEHVKSEPKKRACLEQINELRSRCRHHIPEHHYQFFEHWHNAALLELLRIQHNPTDPAVLGSRLVPQVSESKIRKSIDTLRKLGYLLKTEDGALQPSEPFLSTGDSWLSTAVHAFQVAASGLGVDCLDRFDKDERDVSTLTMALSNEAFTKVREILKDARNKIAQVEAQDSNPQRVYQINFQLFPLSRSQEKGEADV